MRAVLLQLAMCAEGRTAAYDSSGHGETQPIPRLGAGDAPALRFAAMYDAAGDDDERRQAVQLATDELRHIQKSSGDQTTEEPKRDRDRRIVKQGEGLPAREVAIAVRCGVRDVRNARAAAGRDTEYGRLPRNGHELDVDERDREIARLTKQGMSAAQVAHALGLSASTVRRALGLKR